MEKAESKILEIKYYINTVKTFKKKFYTVSVYISSERKSYIFKNFLNFCKYRFASLITTGRADFAVTRDDPALHKAVF